MTSQSGIDPREYRNFAGRFATGVTVITLDDGSGPRGLTANAFTSVSLNPTLLLVCVDHRATSYPFMRKADGFTVNILAEDQEKVSGFFAGTTPPDNPMGGFGFRPGKTGAPILDGVIAWAECRIYEVLAGGDHDIFLGEVIDMGTPRGDAAPLLFYSGKYRLLAPLEG